jgi:hypothetical protein
VKWDAAIQRAVIDAGRPLRTGEIVGRVLEAEGSRAKWSAVYNAVPVAARRGVIRRVPAPPGARTSLEHKGPLNYYGAPEPGDRARVLAAESLDELRTAAARCGVLHTAAGLPPPPEVEAVLEAARQRKGVLS